MKSKRVGSIYVLTVLPIWATVAIFATILMMVLVGRDITEGLMYNVAYSSMFGDVALMDVVLIAASILQRNSRIFIPRWLQSKMTHVFILLMSIILGITVCILTLSSRSGQVMDIYHDIVIVPLFLYLAITLLPVVVLNWTYKEMVATIVLVSFWLALVGFDIKYDRMNQRQWLVRHIDAIEQMKK